VFGKVGCFTCSEILGIGQDEQNWKAIKANKFEKQPNLSSEKIKKQAIISAAYSHQKNEAHHKTAQKAGVLWTDEDFDYCKIDRYCQGSIVDKL
jgi:hypothetical protein